MKRSVMRNLLSVIENPLNKSVLGKLQTCVKRGSALKFPVVQQAQGWLCENAHDKNIIRGLENVQRRKAKQRRNKCIISEGKIGTKTTMGEFVAKTGTKALEECRPDFFLEKKRRNCGTSRPKKDCCDLGPR